MLSKGTIILKSSIKVQFVLLGIYLKLLSYTERKEVETRMRDPEIELTLMTLMTNNRYSL